MGTSPPGDEASRPDFRDPFPIFTVPDLPRSIAFFRDALGFEIGYRWPADGPLDDVAFLVLSLGGSSVGLGRKISAEDEPAIEGEPPVQLCLEVDDIHAAWNWVLAYGARPVTPPRVEEWNEWSAFLDDPSGIRIMLYARIA